jgi:hypothetical protein
MTKRAPFFVGLSFLVTAIAASLLVGGSYLVWVGQQPTRDPHGGALVTLPGAAVLLVGLLLVVLAAQMWAKVRRDSRSRPAV